MSSNPNLKKSSPDTQYWDNRRNRIETDIGKWTGGEDVECHGFSLLNDLFNKVSYMQLQVLNITGRLISPALGKWLENNFMVMSYPDARIWCNQIGALCGTLRTSPTAATAAGSLAADSRVYGGSHTSLLAMQFIQAALQKHRTGTSVEELVSSVPLRQGKPAIMGFARPVARKDERIEPHKLMTKSLGFDIGEHMKLANELAEYLEAKYGMGINIGGYTAAFLSDQGFSPEEVYRIKNICVSSGVTACYVDNLKDPQNSFLPLQCADICYQGPPIRDL